MFKKHVVGLFVVEKIEPPFLSKELMKVLLAQTLTLRAKRYKSFKLHVGVYNIADFVPHQIHTPKTKWVI